MSYLTPLRTFRFGNYTRFNLDDRLHHRYFINIETYANKQFRNEFPTGSVTKATIRGVQPPSRNTPRKKKDFSCCDLTHGWKECYVFGNFCDYCCHFGNFKKFCKTKVAHIRLGRFVEAPTSPPTNSSGIIAALTNNQNTSATPLASNSSTVPPTLGHKFLLISLF